MDTIRNNMQGAQLFRNLPCGINFARLYDAVAPQYARDLPKFRDDLISRQMIVDLAIAFGRDKRVVDLGCGDGHISRLIAPFAREVVGLDASSSMLHEAAIRSKSYPNINFLLHNFLV